MDELDEVVHGSPIGFFNSSRGFETTRPLIPLSLCPRHGGSFCYFRQGGRLDFISGYKFLGRNGSKELVNHLLFTDDTLIFCKDSEDQLAWFEALFGLRI